MTGIVNGLLGRKSNAEKILGRFSPAGFSSSGLSGSFSKRDNTFSLTRGEGVQSNVDRLVSTSAQTVKDLRSVRSDVRPGFGRLTQSRVRGIREAGGRAIGNLREELSKRRIAGSTFASREIAREESRFAMIEDEVRAESFLQELDATRELIGQEFAVAFQSIQSVLEQFNFESSVASNLSAAASNQMQQVITAQAEARASSEAGAAEFLGTVIGAFAPV